MRALVSRVPVLLASVAAGVLLVLTGCGGGSKKVSAASLRPRLLPASLTPHFQVIRTFDWSDPVDLVGQGIFLPEITLPSQAVARVRAAGFRGAAGEQLVRGVPPEDDEIRTGVIRLGSPAQAARLRDWMHDQDLRQPCYVQCIFSPAELRVPGVPSARAVQQVPQVKGPQAPPIRYLAEFAVGPYVYFATAPGDKAAAARFVGGVRAYHQRVAKLG